MTSRNWTQATIALGTIAGMQALRAFFPLLVYGVRDRFGVSSLELGGIALLILSPSVLLPALVRGPRGLAASAGALAVSRFFLQTWTGDPLGSLAAASVGVLAFLGLLAALPRAGFLALAAGLAADASLHAFAGTRDLHWGGALPGVLAGASCVALAVAAWRTPPPGPGEPAPAGLFAWGPFLAVALEVLGNVARLSARTGLDTPAAGACIVGGLVVAALAARAFVTRASSSPWFAPAAGALLLAGLLTTRATGPLAIASVLATQLGAVALLARAVAGVTAPAARVPLAFGAGVITFLMLLFVHYAGYAMPLPFPRTAIFVASGALLLLATRRPAGAGAAAIAPPTLIPPRRWIVPAALLLGLPFLGSLAIPPRSMPRDDDPAALRVVSFNLHAGFDELGGWALDEMLEHLRASSYDAVALQEVSRGWVINGSADLYELARRTLGGESAFGPSSNGDWGNAIFARRVAGAANVPLPPADLPLPRAVLHADVGGVRLYATHFHHVEAHHDVRVIQARALAELAAAEKPEPRPSSARARRIRTVLAAALAGDFNAFPDSECLRTLANAGWTDVGVAGTAAGASPEPTYPSRDPIRRIDTILVRGGLGATSARVEPAWGSDHRAVTFEGAIHPPRRLTR